MQKGEESISNVESVSEEDIKIWIIQALTHKIFLEESLRKNVPKVKEIESQLSKHEVEVRVLEPAKYQVISEEAQAWGIFIKIPVEPIWILTHSLAKDYAILCLFFLIMH